MFHSNIKGHVKAHFLCNTEIAETYLGQSTLSWHFCTYLDSMIRQLQINKQC